MRQDSATNRLGEREQAGGIRRQTMAAALMEELRRRILSQEIAEGAQLRQDALASEFGVSRIPVREALLQLEGEGLVTLSAHRGYTVTRLSLDEIRELFDLRALIEVDLLRRAIPTITDADIRAARDILASFDEMLARETNAQDWGQLNWHLHAALYAPAGRTRAMRIVRNLNRHAFRYVCLQLKITRRAIDRAREDHRRLVDLCERRDTAAATALLSAHILAARDDLIEFLTATRVESAEGVGDGSAATD